MHISLSQNKVTTIDDEDYELIRMYKWYYHKGYVVASNGNTKVYLHRILCNTPDELFTDHINRDKLDNRRCNLRICTREENARNTGGYQQNRYKGVGKFKSYWRARIKVSGIQKLIGYFATPEEAAIAYNTAAKQYHKDFAALNEVCSGY